DDAFDSFRCWLIGQGREVFEGALHDDPDELAELLDDFDEEIDGDGEELGYAADEAYEQLTGIPAPDLELPPAPAQPAGTPIDFEDDAALAERYPRLWSRFRGGGTGTDSTGTGADGTGAERRRMQGRGERAHGPLPVRAAARPHGCGPPPRAPAPALPRSPASACWRGAALARMRVDAVWAAGPRS